MRIPRKRFFEKSWRFSESTSEAPCYVSVKIPSKKNLKTCIKEFLLKFLGINRGNAEEISREIHGGNPRRISWVFPA